MLPRKNEHEIQTSREDRTTSVLLLKSSGSLLPPSIPDTGAWLKARTGSLHATCFSYWIGEVYFNESQLQKDSNTMILSLSGEHLMVSQTLNRTCEKMITEGVGLV